MIDGRALAAVVLVVAVLVVWSILRSPSYAEVEQMITEQRAEELARTRYTSHRWSVAGSLPHVDLPSWAELKPGERDVWIAAAMHDLAARDQ